MTEQPTRSVRLMTLCGCTQILHGISLSVHSINVPVRLPPGRFMDENPSKVVSYARVFTRNGEVDDQGLSVYVEEDTHA